MLTGAYHGSRHVTSPSCAALAFAAALAVGSKILLCPAAPEYPAGEFVIFLTVALIVHLLGPKMAAGKRNVRGCLWIFHKPVLSLSAGRSQHSSFHGCSRQLNLIRI